MLHFFLTLLIAMSCVLIGANSQYYYGPDRIYYSGPHAYCQNIPSQYPFYPENAEGNWKLTKFYGFFDDAFSLPPPSCATTFISNTNGDLTFNIEMKSARNESVIRNYSGRNLISRQGKWFLDEPGFFYTHYGMNPQPTDTVINVLGMSADTDGRYGSILYMTCGIRGCMAIGDIPCPSWNEVGILTRSGTITDSLLGHYKSLLNKTAELGWHYGSVAAEKIASVSPVCL